MSDLHYITKLLKGETDKTGVKNMNAIISVSGLSSACKIFRMDELSTSSEHYRRLWASVGLNPRFMPGVKNPFWFS